ncbi:thymidine kinase [Isoptericola jiangsuensis]|uniref:Thymidine kinase n=1 Tax=Isoptericola jiangsuensis TaxID=548579 RepID=A0A2A9EXV4_9MICO|nr:thymidine kinase [Isoptericola jiangsuensis]PFG43708.1 thymidine kinase [Isoptericola jiangsuensis]
MDHGRAPGRLEVVGGPMFAGKSTELVRRVDRARIAGRGTLVVAHALDVRSGVGRVATHTGLAVESVSVDDAAAIPALVKPDVDLVAVDEAQFFGPALVDVVQGLADDGLDVVVAGLTVTFDGRPFEPLPSLMALAESVTRLTAVCVVCGRDAAYHVRLVADEGDATLADPALVGGQESYEARCRAHRWVAAQ